MHGRPLLIDVAIILVASFPILILGRRLRVPEVVSYLVTGIVIGPHTLALVRDTVRIEAVAEIGVVLILFFVGMHVPLSRLKSLGRTTLVSGSLQMGLTALAILGLALASGIDARRGLFFGLLFSLSSTAVVLPILTQRDELAAPYARKFLGISFFQDFAVIPLMLLVPAFAASRAGGATLADILTKVAVAVVAIVAFVAVARKAIPWLLGRISRLGSREIYTAFAVALVIGAIALAERAGISAALGAFAAGVVVGETEYLHDISSILRPFRDFLAALFFASIGMLLDPGLLLTRPWAVLATVAAIVLLKIAAAYPALRASGTIERTALRASFALVPVGEFSFLLAQEADRYQVLRAGEGEMFIAVAVLTLAATPLFVSLGKWAAERRHHWVEEKSDPTAEPAPAGKILVIGYGLNGRNVARALAQTRVSHTVIDEDPDRIALARANGSPAILADATDPESLRYAGIAGSLAAIVAISDRDGTRAIVHACRASNPAVHLIVRTRYVREVEPLRALGANEVIPEEFETSLEIVTRTMRLLCVPGNVVATQLRILRDEGYRMLRDPLARSLEGRKLAALVASGTSQTYLVLPDTYADGKSLDELGLEIERVAVPALLRDGQPLIPLPRTAPLQPGDTLLLVGAHEDLARTMDRLERELPNDRAGEQVAQVTGA